MCIWENILFVYFGVLAPLVVTCAISPWRPFLGTFDNFEWNGKPPWNYDPILPWMFRGMNRHWKGWWSFFDYFWSLRKGFCQIIPIPRFYENPLCTRWLRKIKVRPVVLCWVNASVLSRYYFRKKIVEIFWIWSHYSQVLIRRFGNSAVCW